VTASTGYAADTLSGYSRLPGSLWVATADGDGPAAAVEAGPVAPSPVVSAGTGPSDDVADGPRVPPAVSTTAGEVVAGEMATGGETGERGSSVPTPAAFADAGSDVAGVTREWVGTGGLARTGCAVERE
jgi:hypothetical protein